MKKVSIYRIFICLAAAFALFGCHHQIDSGENTTEKTDEKTDEKTEEKTDEIDEMEITFDSLDFWGTPSGSFDKETRILKLSKALLKENNKDYEFHGAYFSIKDVEIKGKYIRVDYEQTSGRLSTTVRYTDESEIITPCDSVKKSIYILLDSSKKLDTFQFSSISLQSDLSVKINKLSFVDELELEKQPVVDKTASGNFNNSVSAIDFVKNMEFGFNLANYFDSRNAYNEDLNVCLDWKQPVTTKALVQKVAEAGGKTIRIPVTWCNHIIDDKYTIDPFWMEKVKQVVDWAYDEGYYVILNEHHSVHDNMNSPIIYHEGYILRNTPQDIAESEKFLKAIWTQISAAFNNSYDEHLIFETMNEPRNTDSRENGVHNESHIFYPCLKLGEIDARNCPECIADHKLNNKFNQLILDTIRASGGNNAKRFVMIPSMAGNYETAFVDNFKMPEDSAKDKLILTFHHYPLYNKFWYEEETYQKSIINNIYKTANEKFVKKGIPVIVGEIGPTGANYFEEHNIKIPENEAQAACNYVAQTAGSYGMAVVMWTREYSFENIPFAKNVYESWKTGAAKGNLTPEVNLDDFILWDKEINSYDSKTYKLKINKKWSGGQFFLEQYNDFEKNLTFEYENLTGQIMVKLVYTDESEDVKYAQGGSGNVVYTIDKSKKLKSLLIQANEDYVELTLKSLVFGTED